MSLPELSISFPFSKCPYSLVIALNSSAKFISKSNKSLFAFSNSSVLYPKFEVSDKKVKYPVMLVVQSCQL